MHNPSDAELDELQLAATDHGDDALAAYDAYISALAEYEEAVDEDADLLPYEADIATARGELDKLLGRFIQ